MNLTINRMDFKEQIETSHTKIRYGALDEDEDSEEGDLSSSPSPIFSKVMEEQEAAATVTFNQDRKSVDRRKKRVTELKYNAKIFLLPPMDPLAEASMAIRSEEYMKVLEAF